MDKKAELLAEARQVFAEKGYKKTNISDITKRARMAVGSFYKYFFTLHCHRNDSGDKGTDNLLIHNL